MTAVEWLIEEIEKHYIVNNAMLNPEIIMQLKRQAKEMEKVNELKTKIICWKEALQFINDNYMVELINIRIYNMEVELETFKSE